MKVVLAYGYRLGLLWDSPAGQEAVEQAVLPNWSATAAPADGWIELRQGPEGMQLYDKGKLWTTVADHGAVAQKLQQLIQICLAFEAPGVVFVHAGVVRFGDGLVVVPGPAKAGKSTLVRALVAAGGAFYSDEYAVVDEQGLVHPFPRPMWTRLSRSRRQATPAEQLGWTSALAPAPMRVLLVTRFQAGAAWSPLQLTQDEAVEELWSQTRFANSRPGPVRPLLRRMVAPALCLKGVRGPAEELVTSFSSFSSSWPASLGAAASVLETVRPSPSWPT